MTAPARITLATLADVPEVLPLLLAQFAEHHVPRTDDEARAALVGMLEDPRRGAVFLARQEIPAGLAVMPFTWTVEHGGQVAWLDELYVIPDRRDRGVGGALLHAVIDHARATGCRALDLEVESDHLRAAGLYRRAGFLPLTRTRFSLGLASTTALPG